MNPKAKVDPFKIPEDCHLRIESIHIQADQAQLLSEVPTASVFVPPVQPCNDCGGSGCARCIADGPASQRNPVSR